jgi:hypothetical protein
MKKFGLNLLIAAVTAATLYGQAGIPANAKVVALSGVVEVEHGSAWFPAGMGEFLNPGERIRTAERSTVSLEVGEGKVVTLDELTQIQVRPSTAMAVVQLESGSMKVFATSDVRVAVKDTILEMAERPLDMELGYQEDRLNLTVFNGAVRNGAITIHAIRDTGRTFVSDSRNAQRNALSPMVDPNLYMCPYFMYGNPGPNGLPPANGAIVPPVVNNPTNPGYRPTQIVPPMSDPIRVPITKQ